MPFAGYENFAACVAANSDKDDPEAYCATIMRRVEKARSVVADGHPLAKHFSGGVPHDQSTHGNWSKGPKPEYRSDDPQGSKRAQQEWQDAVTYNVTMGEISPQDASALGWYEGNSGDSWLPLPTDLYHVTTAGSDVRSGGLMTRSELEMGRAKGLGGGSRDTISFTTDRSIAESIQTGILEARKVLRGEITLQDLIRQAQTGEGASRPFFDELMQSFGGKPGEGGIPQGLHNLIDKRQVEYLTLPMTLEKFLAPNPTGHKWYSDRPEDVGAGEWQPLQSWADRLEEKGGGGKKVDPALAISFWRPMSPGRYLDGVFSFYKYFASHRERAGGAYDPLFFGSDPEAIANLDPAEVQLLHYSPVEPGKTMGVQMSGMAEWRISTGHAVRLVDDLAKHFPGGKDHDQSQHGNWATHSADPRSTPPIPGQTQITDETTLAAGDPTGYMWSNATERMPIEEWLEDNYPDYSEESFQEELEGVWVTWEGSKVVREQALGILGLQQSDVPADPHIDTPNPDFGGRVRHTYPPEQTRAQAFYLLDSIHVGAAGNTYTDLWRAVDTQTLKGDEAAFFASLAPGVEFDAPLLATLDTHPKVGDTNLLERFGSDVLFHIRNASGVEYSPTSEFSTPFWTQADEDAWLSDIEVGAPDLFPGIAGAEDDDGVDLEGDAYDAALDKFVTDIRSVITSYRSASTPEARTEARRNLTEVAWVEEGLERWAGETIDETLFPEEYYAFQDEGSGPSEVISGGRFRVTSITSDPTYGRVVEIEQVATFDPFNPGWGAIYKSLVPLLQGEQFQVSLYAYQHGDDEAEGEDEDEDEGEWSVEEAILKHMGPGDHPSGSSQSVHGGGARGPSAPPPSYKFVRSDEGLGYIIPPRDFKLDESAEYHLGKLRELYLHHKSLAASWPEDNALRTLHGAEIDMTWSAMTVHAKHALPAVKARGIKLLALIDERLASSTASVSVLSSPITSEQLSVIAGHSPELKALVDDYQVVTEKYNVQRQTAEALRQIRQDLMNQTVSRRFDVHGDEHKAYAVYAIDESLVTERIIPRYLKAAKEREALAAKNPDSSLAQDWLYQAKQYRENTEWVIKDRDAFLRTVREAGSALRPGEGVHYSAIPVVGVVADSHTFKAVTDEALRAANPGKILFTYPHLRDVLGSASNSSVDSVNRYATQADDIISQIRAKSIRSMGPTEVIRQVLSEHIPLGGSIAVVNARSKGAKIAAENAQYLPSAWIDTSNSAGPLLIELRSARAHYLHEDIKGMLAGKYGPGNSGAKIQMGSSYTSDDFLHEFGHRVEHTRADVLALEQAFYDSRTEGADPVSFGSLGRNYAMMSREQTIPDDFADPYMGKRYGPEGHGKDRRGIGWKHTRYGHYWTEEAYELLSMGLPRIYMISRDGALDVDMHHFLLGLMAETST